MRFFTLIRNFCDLIAAGIFTYTVTITMRDMENKTSFISQHTSGRAKKMFYMSSQKVVYLWVFELVASTGRRLEQ